METTDRSYPPIDDLLGHIHDLLTTAEKAKARLADLVIKAATLYNAGIIEATPSYKNGKYLYLITPMKDGKRQRIYIGSEPEAIQEALEKIDRRRVHADLVSRIHKLTGAISTIDHAIECLQSELSASLPQNGKSPQ